MRFKLQAYLTVTQMVHYNKEESQIYNRYSCMLPKGVFILRRSRFFYINKPNIEGTLIYNMFNIQYVIKLPNRSIRFKTETFKNRH